VVILWGNKKERQVAGEIARKTQTLMTDFFDFSELILLIQYSCLTVSADTLALHVADMVKVPSVGFFGPTSPRRNGSLLKESIHVLKKMECGFCYKKKCGKIECIKKIDIDKIIEAIEKIYEKCR
jgi:ADP-heptose:LPS heptosyltransferase